MLATTHRARKTRACDRECGHLIRSGDLVEYSATPPGVIGNPGWLRSVTHAGRCPIDGPTADAWNSAYPVGTPVFAWPGTRDDTPLWTRTRTLAWDLASGHPVAAVDDYPGGILLTHLQPLETPDV
jgi:hypothetical protein